MQFAAIGPIVLRHHRSGRPELLSQIEPAPPPRWHADSLPTPTGAPNCPSVFRSAPPLQIPARTVFTGLLPKFVAQIAPQGHGDHPECVEKTPTHAQKTNMPVSYTHLTLPTNRE